MAERSFTAEERARRQAQVVQLLRMSDDWLPGPRLPRLYAATDRVALAGDAYVEDRSTSFAARSGDDRHAASHRRDATIARLERAYGPDRGKLDPKEKEPWEAAKDALYGQGSFRELHRALAELRASDLYAWTCLLVVHGWDPGWRRPGVLVVQAASTALAFVEVRMPDPIRVPGPRELEVAKSWWQCRDKRGEDARARRDAEIRALSWAGVAQKEIGAKFGLTQQTVSEIVRRGAGLAS